MQLSLPSRVHVELTSRCNFHCTTCKHGYVEFGNDLRDQCVEIIIKELLPHLSEIELQGTGESLLSVNFAKLFAEARKYNDLKKILITNASLLTKSMIYEFVASNMNLIVSLDGADLNSFRLNRPYGNFDTIIKNLNLIGVLKRETNNPNFNFIINMVVTRNNYSCIMKLIELAYQVNIDFIQISEVRECMPDKSVWKALRLDNYEERPAFEEYIADCKKFAEQKGIGFYFNQYRHHNVIKKRICCSPWRHIYISSEGAVSFCCEQSICIGNLNHQSFHAIWNSNKANHFRNAMLFGNYDDVCRNCCLPWGLTYE